MLALIHLLIQLQLRGMRSLFTLFSIARSPLILTSNLLRNEDDIYRILTQPDCIAVNQRGEKPLCLSKEGDLHVWRSRADGRDYLACFNLADEDLMLDVPVPDDCAGRTALDVWTAQSFPIEKGTMKLTIASHGVVFLRII